MPHLPYFGHNKNVHFKCKTVTIKYRNVLIALSLMPVFSVAGTACH